MIDPVKKAVVGRSPSTCRACAKEAIQPVGIRFTSDGKLGFVALGPANRVAVVDGATKQVDQIRARRTARLAPRADARRQAALSRTNGVSNDVTVIDVASLKALKSIPVGSYPWGVAITRQ